MCLRLLETLFVKFVSTCIDAFHTLSAALARLRVEKRGFPLLELIFGPCARYTRRVTGFVSMQVVRKSLNQPNIVCGYLHRPLNPPTAEVERERGLWELDPPNLTGAVGFGGANSLNSGPRQGRGCGWVHGVWASSNNVPSQPGHYPPTSDAQKNFQPTEYTLTPVYRPNITPLTPVFRLGIYLSLLSRARVYRVS